MPTRKFEPERAIEIIAPSYGTAYRIGGQLALTCKHLVENVKNCRVRSKWKKDNYREGVEATVIWRSARFDVALVSLPKEVSSFPPVVFGQLPQQPSEEWLPFSMYGWPEWGRTRTEEGTLAGGRQIDGKIYLADRSGQGYLVLTPERIPTDIDPSKSSWAGLSGAAILCKGRVIALQRQHQRLLQADALEAEKLTNIYDDPGWCKWLRDEGIDPEPETIELSAVGRCKVRTVMLSSLVITALCIFVRGALQAFQPFELSFYDALMRNRFNVPQLDNRFLMVRITPEDVRDQINRGEPIVYDSSLSDQTLKKFLEATDKFNPVAVGLDIYRERNISGVSQSDSENLKKLFAQPNVFALCKVGYGSDKAIPPPPYVSPERIGFSDFSTDYDGILRRNLLAFDSKSSECTSHSSFSLVLAKHYLQTKEDIKTDVSLSENCQIKFTGSNKEIVISNLQANTGGYQGYSGDDNSLFYGCQILLNYTGAYEDKEGNINDKKNEKNEKNEIFTLEEFFVLDPSDPENAAYRERIILIGVDRSDGIKGDYWETPYNSGQPSEPGFFIQAQMINQLIDVALEKQSLIWVLPRNLDALLILVFAFLGGSACWWWAISLQDLRLLAVVCCSGVVIFLVSFFAFQFNGWIPLVPYFFSLSSTSICVCWFNMRVKE